MNQWVRLVWHYIEVNNYGEKSIVNDDDDKLEPKYMLKWDFRLKIVVQLVVLKDSGREFQHQRMLSHTYVCCSYQSSSTHWLLGAVTITVCMPVLNLSLLPLGKQVW